MLSLIQGCILSAVQGVCGFRLSLLRGAWLALSVIDSGVPFVIGQRGLVGAGLH